VTEYDYEEWVASIRRKAEQLRIVFLQLGHSNEPARRALTSTLTESKEISEYLQSEEPPARRLIVIDGLESLAGPAARGQFGPLRERVFAEVEAGGHVILLSRAPRIAFPRVVGSSLLDDASFAHAPTVPVGGHAHWPTCAVDEVAPAEALCRALAELGPELCAALDRVIYENLITGEVALSLLSAREVEALDASGITRRTKDSRAWNFPKHLAPLKSALDDVLAGELDAPQQLFDVSAGLWRIERTIRREIRKRAKSAWSTSWRQQCLNGDLPSKVLERATEAAYLGATSIKQLRDPLEWLSLGELLQLKDRSEIGDLGMTAALWRQFSAQIMPIRNRLAHMRTLRPEDAAEVIKWRQVIEVRIGAR
jgi:hypothetical protein